jgi:CRP-like cAMP-binding protein
LWRTHRTAFQYTLAHHTHYEISDAETILRKVALFKDLDEKALPKFAKAMTPLSWTEGTKIVRKGDQGNVFHLIQSGRVKQTDVGLGDSGTSDLELGPGDWFGEQSMLLKEPSYADVIAVTNVVTMAMDRKTFEHCMGPVEVLLLRSLREKMLLSVPMFSASISKPEITHLADLITEVCYPKGATIAKAGEPSEMKLWMIRHGRLLVYSEKADAMYSLKAGDYFGDDSIKAHGEYVSKHTVVCEENLTAWTLSRDQIESIVGDTDRLGEVEAYTRSKIKRQFALADLTRHRIIGRGGYGTVWVVSHEDDSGSKELYALKSINKAAIVSAKLHKAVLREKEMLCLLDHPFISSLIASFQDEANLYLVTPLILGGELYDILQKKKINSRGLPFNAAAFYAAGVLEALGYFHRREIAYRDLKLENVLIDDDGYPKIIDLGFAKVVTHKTFTMCGTMEYLAPEIIIAKGHDTAVDYWAFGVLLFELVAGKSPFFAPRSSQVETFTRILKMEYTVPDFFTESIKDLVKRLLVRRPTERLGSLASGHLGVQRHAWFLESGIKVKDLLAKRISAPWKPPFVDATRGPSVDDPYHRRENTRNLTRAEQELFMGF